VLTYSLVSSTYLQTLGWTLKLNLRDKSPNSKISKFFFDGGQPEEDLYYYYKLLPLHLRKKSWEDREKADAGEQADEVQYKVALPGRISLDQLPTNYYE
jgi:hypothetical protein